MSYEVQEYCAGDWENTWSVIDEQDRWVPETFDTFEEANDELRGHYHDVVDAYFDGDMIDFPDSNNFRIVEVESGEIQESMYERRQVGV